MGSRLTIFSLPVAVFLLDRLTKWLIRTRLGPFDTHRIVPGFLNIVHAENPGVAFGLLSDASGAWRDIVLIGLAAAVIVFILVVLLKPGRNPAEVLTRAGLALILGGAAGNLFDRIASGTVTDFIEVYLGAHYFPAFNVADSAITIGAGLLLLDMWFSRAKKVAAPLDVS